MIEAYVDPFEPPMPPNGEMEFVKGLAKSFAKGQPCAKRIGLDRNSSIMLYWNCIRISFSCK